MDLVLQGDQPMSKSIINYLCSVYWCSVYGVCKRSDTLWPAGCVRLFADYTISLSSLCRLELIKCCRVCLRLRLFSQLSFIQYMGLCVFSLPNSPVMLWESVLNLIIVIKSEVWIINHCLALGHETMVCAVCLTMFLSNRWPTLKLQKSHWGNDLCHEWLHDIW